LILKNAYVIIIGISRFKKQQKAGSYPQKGYNAVKARHGKAAAQKLRKK